MIPMDPKKAQKLGQAWGEVLTDSVFGIVDVVKNAPAQKAANNQKVINKNKVTEINNQITRNNNLLREQAMKEIAAEQEQEMLARMTPAQRNAFKQAKINDEQARKRAARLAQEKHDEMVQIFWVCVLLFVVLPAITWIGLLIYGLSDPMAYYSMKDWLPLLKTLSGHR
jgi:hypothetical protein